MMPKLGMIISVFVFGVSVASSGQQVPFGFFTTAPAVASCSGVQVGGYCWYYGALGENCYSVCTAHGGCDLNGILNYAGSNGSDANCVAVMDALGAPGGTVTSSSTAVGCEYRTSSSSRRRATSTTSCVAAGASSYIACSCVN